MGFRYVYGAIISEVYRYIKVFPNSDPLMGLILPAARNEPRWKAPLLAFSTMFIFDIFTSGIGAWTWVTSATYALIALAFSLFLKGRKMGLRGYLGAGTAGVLAFDFITGPVMSSVLFQQSFILTAIMQVPFTVMHLVSAAFSILIITPFLDKDIAAEMNAYVQAAKAAMVNWRVQQ